MKDAPYNPDNNCTALWEFPPVSPGSFFDMMNQFNQGARLLCLIDASVRLGIFDALTEWKSEKDIEDLIKYPHPVTDFVKSLVKTGFVEWNNGKIKNTTLASTYLTKQSPYFQGAYLEKSMQHIKDLWLGLSDILSSGPLSYNEEQFFANLSLPSMAQNALCGRLQEVVRSIVSLPTFSAMRKMIDLGGGHGLYAIALACKNPNLSAIIFDLPGVVTLAEQYI
ncbi:MAG TPA: methyltransferase, partial [Methanospirillum sp.]|nr:methyltransferase [Methanospirillum sp.]